VHILSGKILSQKIYFPVSFSPARQTANRMQGYPQVIHNGTPEQGQRISTAAQGLSKG
jgi:hypothetical protein